MRVGGKVVGVFCPYTPNELVMAAGAVPIAILYEVFRRFSTEFVFAIE